MRCARASVPPLGSSSARMARASDRLGLPDEPFRVAADDRVRARASQSPDARSLSRTVRQGTPSTVVSSWTPPESVTTSRASAITPMKSGSRGLGRDHDAVPAATARRAPAIRSRVRGWTGKTTGSAPADLGERIEKRAERARDRRRSRAGAAWPARMPRSSSPSRAGVRDLARGSRRRSSVSIIVLPAKRSRSAGIPSRGGSRSASRLVA